jgi:dsDNA-binding SOS-regulon protein
MGVPNHTPGPWEYEFETAGGAIQTRRIIGRIERYASAHPAKSCTEVCRIASHAEADANARLIAAAPEMLEALLQARDILVHTYKWETLSVGLAQIQAAIAKAIVGGKS